MIDGSEDYSVNPMVECGATTLDDVIAVRLSRRTMLGGLAALTVGGCVRPNLMTTPALAHTPFSFREIARGLDGTHHVAVGYRADVLIRWGDPLFADSPSFDAMAQTPTAQLRQFGYNNDFIGVVPLPRGDAEERALLCINHEYTSTPLMFPGVASNYPQELRRGARHGVQQPRCPA